MTEKELCDKLYEMLSIEYAYSSLPHTMRVELRQALCERVAKELYEGMTETHAIPAAPDAGEYDADDIAADTRDGIYSESFSVKRLADQIRAYGGNIRKQAKRECVAIARQDEYTTCGYSCGNRIADEIEALAENRL